MTTVHRYDLQIGRTALEIPMGAAVLSAQMRDHRLVLWMRVNLDWPTCTRHFQTFGTGEALPDELLLAHIATVQVPNGLTWHIFETSPGRGK